jgi:hypothetical protein
VKEGDKYSEYIHHKYFHCFKDFFLDFLGNEWYVTDLYHEFIVNAFNNVPLDNMKEVIWENRENLLSTQSEFDKKFWMEVSGIKGLVDEDSEIDKKMFKILSSGRSQEILDEKLKEAVETIGSFTRHPDRLREYYKYRDLFSDDQERTEGLIEHFRFADFELYYSHFGIDTCKSVSYRAALLKDKLSDEIRETPLRKEIYNSFSLKSRYSLREIKKTLSKIYKKVGIIKTAKATDLKQYFNVSRIGIVDQSTGKRVNGYELISIK